MVEAEMAFFDNDDNIALQEQFVSYVVGRILERRGEDLAQLGRDTKPLALVTPPFERISYDEAIKILKEKGRPTVWGDDLTGEDETVITGLFKKPVFVVNYPRKAKAFYMKADPARPDQVLCADLLAPEGYGEIIGGSQREDDYGKLLARIREDGLPEDSYEWYLELRKYGSVVHSGFGLGLERTLAWICGLEHLQGGDPVSARDGKDIPVSGPAEERLRGCSAGTAKKTSKPPAKRNGQPKVARSHIPTLTYRRSLTGRAARRLHFFALRAAGAFEALAACGLFRDTTHKFTMAPMPRHRTSIAMKKPISGMARTR